MLLLEALDDFGVEIEGAADRGFGDEAVVPPGHDVFEGQAVEGFSDLAADGLGLPTYIRPRSCMICAISLPIYRNFVHVRKPTRCASTAAPNLSAEAAVPPASNSSHVFLVASEPEVILARMTLAHSTPLKVGYEHPLSAHWSRLDASTPIF